MKFIPQKTNQEKLSKITRKIIDTKDRIFPYKKSEEKNFKKIKTSNYKTNYDHLNEIQEKGKNEIKRWESKPCNNDFQKVADEAKNNLNKRYYFDNTTSFW